MFYPLVPLITVVLKPYFEQSPYVRISGGGDGRILLVRDFGLGRECVKLAVLPLNYRSSLHYKPVYNHAAELLGSCDA